MLIIYRATRNIHKLKKFRKQYRWQFSKYRNSLESSIFIKIAFIRHKYNTYLVAQW